jgi:hypothetical protein
MPIEREDFQPNGGGKLDARGRASVTRSGEVV